MKMLFCFLLAFLTACSGNTLTLTSQALTTATSRVSAGTDDAEQRVRDNVVQTSSSDLELTYENWDGQQIAGMRFPGLDVPRGAVVTSARLQVSAASSSKGTVNLRVYAQASDDAAPFAAIRNDIGARPRTSAYQSWSPGSWSSGAAPYSYGVSGAGLASAIQEVIARPGWVSGNALALIFPHTATKAFRNVVSFNGDPSKAPRLNVTYEVPATPLPEPEPAPEPEPTPTDPGHGTLIFEDNFNGTSLNTQVWDYCFGWTNPDGCHNRSNSSSAVYLPRNVEVSNGTLKLHAKKERVTVGGTVWEYTSGMVSSHSDYRDGGFLHNKGYMEFRAKVPGFEGSWPAIWNHAAGGKWPPEIDVMESINNECDAEFHYHYLEGGTGSKRAFGAQTNDVNICDTWRTYAVEWTSTSITWYLDGVQRAKFTPSNPDSIADEPMYLIMNLGVGGDWPGDMTGQELNETMEIDFVRIYK